MCRFYAFFLTRGHGSSSFPFLLYCLDKDRKLLLDLWRNPAFVLLLELTFSNAGGLHGIAAQ